MSNKTRKQLIFFWSYVEWGGAQIYLLAIMKQAKHDWDVKVILPRASSPDIVKFIEAVGVDHEFIDFSLDLDPAPTVKRKLQRQWRRVLSEILTFKHLLRFNLRESILHIEAIPWQSWILLTALRMRRANVFVTMHNSMSGASFIREAIWKIRMEFVSRLKGFHIFASNQDTKNKLRRWVAPDFWRSTRVTYTAIDPAEVEKVRSAVLDREALCKRYDLPTDKFLILCVGQFIDRKGRWTFLDAARIIGQSTRDAVFVWVTPVLPDASAQAKIEGYNLGNSFRLLLSGTIGETRECVLRFFRLADIFVLPSFVEGLPIALLEAMALGIPCVSTSVYAIPEAIKHRKTGLLVEPGQSEDLAEAILQLKGDLELRNSLAEAGREHVLKHFDERVAARTAIDAYRGCFPPAE